MNRHPELPRVIEQADMLAQQWDIPSEIISLHRNLLEATTPSGESLAGKPQYSLRWGAFLLIYAPMEGFFNEILDYRTKKNRTLPLNPDKLRNEAKRVHEVDLFTSSWGLRTRTLLSGQGNRSRWHLYTGNHDIGKYLADMKSLRDRLSHGGDPYTATNQSGALWPIQKGFSMQLMGVEGFLQACSDLAGQTILSYGGDFADIPAWPEPKRSGLSTERRPALPLLP